MEPKNRLHTDEDKVNASIGRVRSRGHRLAEDTITLSHGAGGKASAALTENVFMPVFGNGDGDAAVLAGLATGAGQLAMSTDSYVVNPIEFPGGTIGDLAVNGTVNDLAMLGVTEPYLTASFILEEGLSIDTLREIVATMGETATAAGAHIVAGDTKVVPQGSADKLFITTAGVGVTTAQLGYDQVGVGDVIIVSGPIADHGMAVMMARGDLAISAPIASDTRALNGAVAALLALAPGSVHFLRDATRGGLATVLNELARGCGLGMVIEDEAVPVREMTRAACDMLGIDPLYVANEGTFVSVVAADHADAALSALHEAGFPDAVRIGTVQPEPAESVVLVTGFGGTRMVDMLVGDPLPRIC
ncbi:MAG: hydrogenase expression/formation protein HypE [Corynebacterium sp.]|nr:hydrogenase expression/formation protein HypE [Corynebacterium sp.]